MQRHEPTPSGLLIGLQLAGSTAKLDCSFRVARRDGSVGRGPRGTRCSPFEAGASALHPLLEIGGDVLDVEPGEEVAVIQREGVLESLFGDELFEHHRIAAQGATAERHFIARAEKQVGVDGTPQVMERLAQGSPRLLVTELGPEQRQERVSPDGAGGREREIGEQRHAFRLDARRRGTGVVSAEESDAAEGEKLAHDGATVCRGPVAGNSDANRRRYLAITARRDGPTTAGSEIRPVHMQVHMRTRHARIENAGRHRSCRVAGPVGRARMPRAVGRP